MISKIAAFNVLTHSASGLIGAAPLIEDRRSQNRRAFPGKLTCR